MALTLTFPTGCALVAGGTGSVGQGVTRRLAQAGVPVIFTYRSGEERAIAFERELRADGLDATRCQMDLGDVASIDAAIAVALAKGGRLHTVAYAAGPSIPFDNLADLAPAAAEKFFVDDAMGCYRLFHSALPHLRKGGGGSLLTCTTIALKRVIVYDGISPFSKGAVDALVRQLAAEEAQHGIRCNAVAIGWVSPQSLDEMLAQLPPVKAEPIAWEEKLAVLIEQLRGLVRMGRPAVPDEAGNLFAFLASDQAAYITGQSIAFDGGATL
jgi:NAD(P)-dependent dehydrogenase (short-subunit alcohol dehydrogenase family)